jgi:hypothetical protein
MSLIEEISMSTIDAGDPAAAAAALAAPFDAGEVKFKPQTVSGNRALAIAFVDARVIQDRLDDVLGVMGWQDSYECLPDGSVVCRLSIRIGGEWITKTDVGSQSEQPDEGDRRKAAFSDALKRASVKFGVGRYLYRMKPQWVDYDPQKRQFVRTPALPGVQAPVQRDPGQSHSTQRPPAPPSNGQAPAVPQAPDDRGRDKAECVTPQHVNYLKWLSSTRGESLRDIAGRRGLSRMGIMTIEEYGEETRRLNQLPARGQHV